MTLIVDAVRSGKVGRLTEAKGMGRDVLAATESDSRAGDS